MSCLCFRCLSPSICWGASLSKFFCLVCCQDTGTSCRQYNLSRYRSLFSAWFFFLFNVWTGGYLAHPNVWLGVRLKKWMVGWWVKTLGILHHMNWYMYFKIRMWNQQVLKSSESCTELLLLILYGNPLPLFHLKVKQV